MTDNNIDHTTFCPPEPAEEQPRAELDRPRAKPARERLQRTAERAFERASPRAGDGAAGVCPQVVDLGDAADSAELGREGVIVLAAEPSATTRVNLLAAGALAVLDATRPLAELERTTSGIAARCATSRTETTLDDLNSRSRSMRHLLQFARRTAAADSSLLLTGPTGVGKEHLARAVHASGPRRGRPFVVLNCGALPENLLESQLFGHERGAFTGADRQHKGFFEDAEGGTILLDEIGEMPQHLQVKLLNVLERREVTRLGGHKPTPVDVRVMAATNRDIDQDVARGAFREDLFYRLNVIHLRLPPLSKRTEDVPDLAGRFLHDYCAALELGRFAGIDEAAVQALIDYPWPGNVRELRNVLERCLVLTRSTRIGVDDLPAEVRQPERRPPAAMATMQWLAGAGAAAGEAPPAAAGMDRLDDWEGKTLRQVRDAAVATVERAFLEYLLRQTGGRVGRTAERAGIRPRSLYDKMKQLGLRKEDYRGER